MRIANVCPRYYPDIGGVETNVKEVSERLVGKNFEVEILSTDPSMKLPTEEVVNGVKVKRFKSWAPNESYCFSGELKKYLMKNSDSYDIVHAHQYHALPALYAAQAKNRNKLVFNPYYHGRGHTFIRDLLHKPYRFIGRSIFRRSDKIVCISNHEKSLILSNFEISEEKIAIIPCGVDLGSFRAFKKRKKEFRSILSVCRLEKYKGIQYLIKVLPSIDQDIILEVVGKGPYKRDLVKLAKELRVDNRVKFYQDLSKYELLGRYCNADLFALLSRYESYGISVAEALASKVPCIVSDTSALKEWIDNENCFGIRYPVNLDDLRNLITRVIGKNVGQLKLLTWEEVTEKLIGLYKEVREDDVK